MKLVFYIFFTVLCVSGCTSYSSISQITAMPEPIIYQQQVLRDRLYTDGISENNTIFYATDRESSSDQDDGLFYTNQRGSFIRVGLGNISPSTFNDKNKIKVSDVNEYGYLSTALPYGKLSSPEEANEPGLKIANQQFSEAVDEKLAASRQKDIFIYVHGYKTVFENPLLVSSEFWQYMNNDGVFIAYAWPATPKRLAYFKDVETAQLSGHNLRLFIEYLAKNTEAERIHIIGYSAGTRVVITATQQLALKYYDQPQQKIKQELRIGNIILAASDYDPRVFAAAIGHELLNIPEMMTVYMSASDDALGLSRFLFGEGRLGQFIDKSASMADHTKSFFNKNKKLYFINASTAKKAAIGNGHGYYFSSPWVSSDLLLILRYGLKPGLRGLIKPEGKLHWIFTDNHPNTLQDKLSWLAE